MRQKTFPIKILDELVIGLGGARKVRFCETRQTFQWAIPALKLGIEIAGYMMNPTGWKKYNRAVSLGWRYLRFTEHEVRVGIAKEMIGKFIENNMEGK